MIYLLDTNTCIRFLNGRSPNLVQELPTIPVTEIAICSIVKAELFLARGKVANQRLTAPFNKRFFKILRHYPLMNQS